MWNLFLGKQEKTTESQSAGTLLLEEEHGGLEVGEHIWIPDAREVWRSGLVTGFKEGCCVVETDKSDGCSEKVQVPLLSKLPGESPTYFRRQQELLGDHTALNVQDVSKLSHLDEPSLLHTLQARFRSLSIYTFAGPMLLAINPFETVTQLYNGEVLRQFSELPPDEPDPAPHIYGVARRAYEDVRLEKASQTILVSGVSGAGKTETTKFVMRYLALAGTGCKEDTMSTVERRVLESIPLLEALGNAKTLRNDNSSRFGKYIELHFGSVPGVGVNASANNLRLVGARTHTYLLEKVRVISMQEGERSFHIFYQVLAAAAAARVARSQSPEVCEKPLLFDGTNLSCVLGKRAADFKYLARSADVGIDGRKESLDLQRTVTAMRSFAFEQQEIDEVLSTIVAVLHLGNLSFGTPASNSEGSEIEGKDEAGGPLDIVSALLGVESSLLEAAFCRQSRKVRDERSDYTISGSRTTIQAADGRDALARHLYGSIFTYIVEKINAVLQDGSANGDRCHRSWGSLPFVGVLDIFGFECFENNSFEQLCINFTNELLQEYFNEVIFEHETMLYAREQVAFDPKDFPDNKEIVRLLEGDRKDLLSGVFPLLDEECNVTSGSVESYCRKLLARYAGSKRFKAVKIRRCNFVVHHFAGPVEYDAEAFLAKNKDKQTADVLECLKGSSKSFIRQRFDAHGWTFGTQTSAGSGRVTRTRAASVSLEFRNQLKALMESIRKTNPHFVRCIKPNPHSLPKVFDRQTVVEQLRYQGVLQSIEVARAGYPVRLRHREAVRKYWCLAESDMRHRLELEMSRGAFAAAASLLFGGFEASFSGIEAGMLQVGLTLVFLKKGAAEVLYTLIAKARQRAASKLQSVRRGHLCRKKFRQTLRAVCKLQAGARGAADRKLARHLRRERAARHIQSVRRRQAARATCRARLSAVAILQRWAHARLRRMHFLDVSRLVLRIQRWFRRSAGSRRSRRRAKEATRIQNYWRMILAMDRRKFLLEAMLRRRWACRKLVNRWRQRVLTRVRRRIWEPTDVEAIRTPFAILQSSSNYPRWEEDGSAFVDEPVMPACDREKSEMIAASAALRRKLDVLNYETATLERQCSSFHRELRSSGSEFLRTFQKAFSCCTSREMVLARDWSPPRTHRTPHDRRDPRDLYVLIDEMAEAPEPNSPRKTLIRI